MTDLTGTELGGWPLEKKIGGGGQATVYLSRQASVERQVAVKVLHPEQADTGNFRARFRQEAVTAAKLQHPNVLPVIDYGEQDGYHYIVMQLVRGRAGETSLADRFRKRRRLSPEEALPVIDQVGKALDYAHGQGVQAHRDVKPGNILLDEQGNCLLTDFGIVKIIESDDEFLTQPQTAIGTPHYMSPEQCRGETLDGRADVYSLGVVLYQALTGKLPFNAETATGVVTKVLHDPPEIPADANLSREVQEVLLRALAKRADDRYASCAELTAALASAIEKGSSFGEQDTVGEKTRVHVPQAPPAAEREPEPGTARGSRKAMLGVGLVALVGGAFGISQLVAGGPGTGAVTPVRAGSLPVVEFASAADTVVEGESIRATIRMNGSFDEDVVVPIRATGTSADPEKDVERLGKEVRIPAGRASADFEVRAVADAEEEVDEVLVVELLEPVGAKLGAVTRFEVTIRGPARKKIDPAPPGPPEPGPVPDPFTGRFPAWPPTSSVTILMDEAVWNDERPEMRETVKDVVIGALHEHLASAGVSSKTFAKVPPPEEAGLATWIQRNASSLEPLIVLVGVQESQDLDLREGALFEVESRARVDLTLRLYDRNGAFISSQPVPGQADDYHTVYERGLVEALENATPDFVEKVATEMQSWKSAYVQEGESRVVALAFGPLEEDPEFQGWIDQHLRGQTEGAPEVHVEPASDPSRFVALDGGFKRVRTDLERVDSAATVALALDEELALYDVNCKARVGDYERYVLGCVEHYVSHRFPDHGYSLRVHDGPDLWLLRAVEEGQALEQLDLQRESTELDVAALSKSVLLVVLEGPGGAQPGGTAWMVGPNLAATNAHVAELMADADAMFVRGTGGGVEAQVERVTIHPGYKKILEHVAEVRPIAEGGGLATQDIMGLTFDVALLHLAEPTRGTLPAPLEIASRADLEDLAAPTPVALLGYPCEQAQGTGVNVRRPVPLFHDGRVTGVVDYFRGEAGPRERVLIRTDAESTGGASGSPLFRLSDGKVVGLLNAGTIVDAGGSGRRIPLQGFNFAQRADLLLDLLDGESAAQARLAELEVVWKEELGRLQGAGETWLLERLVAPSLDEYRYDTRSERRPELLERRVFSAGEPVTFQVPREGDYFVLWLAEYGEPVDVRYLRGGQVLARGSDVSFHTWDVRNAAAGEALEVDCRGGAEAPVFLQAFLYRLTD